MSKVRANQARRQLEHGQACALMQWARLVKLPASESIEAGAYLSDYLIAIPNGGARSGATGAKLKAEGVKAGVSDYLLALPYMGRAGLWLELKIEGGPGPKPNQKQWLARMSHAGYATAVAYGWADAVDHIRGYLHGMAITGDCAGRSPGRRAGGAAGGLAGGAAGVGQLAAGAATAAEGGR